MASESTEEGSLSVDLGSELDEWLDEQATEHETDRETALVQLVAALRGADLASERDTDALAAALADTDALQAAVRSTAGDLAADQAEELRADFQAKLEDVRERVVQVKTETDARAPADHSHEELARVDAIGTRLAALEETVDGMERDLAALSEDVTAAADDERIDTLATAVDDLEERLTTVAWVVSDLRESVEGPDGSATLSELKREAARIDVSRAACERCGEGVELGLMTEPACPHCAATVTSVEPASGFFGSPQLLVAAQLESGADQ